MRHATTEHPQLAPQRFPFTYSISPTIGVLQICWLADWIIESRYFQLWGSLPRCICSVNSASRNQNDPLKFGSNWVQEYRWKIVFFIRIPKDFRIYRHFLFWSKVIDVVEMIHIWTYLDLERTSHIIEHYIDTYAPVRVIPRRINLGRKRPRLRHRTFYYITNPSSR